ncbi:ABC transporter permease [Actinokineospora sp. PR83]|uniref:ABC transporter permease n=1 Tax=Actinokineospora sp. PR83 TaxID=2884908 RepID=UPI001F252292|nr:ABC transporter permease [Actinokineospora sp. PR83]MCG8914790.1 ABC transporter permease [Actinokineospora sp. PR83]
MTLATAPRGAPAPSGVSTPDRGAPAARGLTTTAVNALSDAGALFGRHLRHLVRMPEKLLAATVMPVAYVALFGVLFGSAMAAPGGNYQDYLMAGILAQTMLTNLSSTALGVATDLGNGLVDRFRSLPMSDAAVLAARTASNVVVSAISIAVMAGVGYLIGWRLHNGVGQALLGFGLLLLLGFAMAWVGALLGLLVRDAEAISSVAVLVVLPLTFLSNAFIPLGGLPGWLRVVCEWNPLSAVVTACRQLFGNETGPLPGSLPGQYPLAVGTVLVLVLLAVAGPLAVRAYRRAVTR